MFLNLIQMSNYQQQVDYYNYVEKQRSNYVDLAKSNPNDCVKIFANILFSKPVNDLSKDLTGIVIDESMEIIDCFCMLIELVLYGINILTNGQNEIFDLVDVFDPMVDLIKKYIKSMGFDLILREELFFDKDEIYLYRDRDDYYCQVTNRPPELLCYDSWYVLNYKLITNKKFSFDQNSSLDIFKAFFISSSIKFNSFSEIKIFVTVSTGVPIFDVNVSSFSNFIYL